MANYSFANGICNSLLSSSPATPSLLSRELKTEGFYSRTLLAELSNYKETTKNNSVESKQRARTFKLLGSSFAWLMAAQLIRTYLTGNDFFTHALSVTVVPELILTYLTIESSLGTGIEKLRKFIFKKPVLTFKEDFLFRSFANVSIGGTYIVFSWGMFSGLGRNAIGANEVAAAYGLCAVVYPILQGLRHYMFVVNPRNHKHQSFEDILRISGHPISTSVIEFVFDNLIHDVNKDLKSTALVAIDSIVHSFPIELKILDDIQNKKAGFFTQPTSKVVKLATKINSSKNLKAASNFRRKLIVELVKTYDQNISLELNGYIGKLLKLDPSLDSRQSVEIHRALAKYHQDKSFMEKVFVFTDGLAASGIAGGIGLYELNRLLFPGVF